MTSHSVSHATTHMGTTYVMTLFFSYKQVTKPYNKQTRL